MALQYNKAVWRKEPARRAYNQAVWRRYEAGEFDNANEALAAYKQPPPLAQGKFTKNWVWKFKSDWGHLDKETNTHGVFMEPQDAQMVNMRDQENARLQKENIQHCLLLIYDQLWKKNYRGKKRKAFKDKRLCGQRSGRTKGRPRHLGRKEPSAHDATAATLKDANIFNHVNSYIYSYLRWCKGIFTYV